MCRNIRPLHNFEPAATPEEIRAAALQYVRKISGTTKPSQANQAAFDRAVEEVAHISAHLLEHLVTTAPPKDRETVRCGQVLTEDTVVSNDLECDQTALVAGADGITIDLDRHRVAVQLGSL